MAWYLPLKQKQCAFNSHLTHHFSGLRARLPTISKIVKAWARYPTGPPFLGLGRKEDIRRSAKAFTRVRISPESPIQMRTSKISITGSSELPIPGAEPGSATNLSRGSEPVSREAHNLQSRMQLPAPQPFLVL